MNVFTYNCHELRKPRVVGVLWGIVEDKDPDVDFLCETKLKDGE